jgi:predicted ATP-dependent endonuclease of OLD family
MRIGLVEIGNFRKLQAVRIDLANETTLLVGANNSGKTSAMVAMRHFLVERGNFSIHDFTLSNWPGIDAAGQAWEDSDGREAEVNWDKLLPHLDLWLQVGAHELHHVLKLLPSLDWAGQPIGVRLRFEPKDVATLRQSYLLERAKAKGLLAALSSPAKPAGAGKGFAPWPSSLTDFLSTKLRSTFVVRAYLLDPAAIQEPDGGIAKPQPLPQNSEPVEGDPLGAIIRIDDINAQRGFGFSSSPAPVDGSEAEPMRGGKRLSSQLRSYYTQHLDPSDSPEPEDADALLALHDAQEAFSKRLATGFKDALEELHDIGYPGITDPRLTITAKVKAVDGLNHPSAVQYEVPSAQDGGINLHRLPEDSNGLGYQNLVSIVFALMSFRDRWFLVGRAGAWDGEPFRPPLHLVLIEEPEAHLHAQVQQVFIKQAYAILRKSESLGSNSNLHTQLVVSTHSSHVVHEVEFASLRYFRRLPVQQAPGSIPVSCVVNLTTTFGTDQDTARFVRRYLKATHCDLFFADGAVLVEGPAERILVPHFVRSNPSYSFLDRCYITWLEIGGSHAHRLRSLLEHVGINTLIITDIDAMDQEQTAVPPSRSKGLKARNETLSGWLPGTDSLDALLDKKPADIQVIHPSGYGIRVAYQQPIAHGESAITGELLANTFEDALLYTNLSVFQDLPGTGLIAKFRKALAAHWDNYPALAAQVHADLAKGQKAELALDLLYGDATLKVPAYIHDGLVWLEDQLRLKEKSLDAEQAVASAGDLPTAETPEATPAGMAP